ncbi:hypothetical protein EVAR_24511_1 [Eumeta japonica]|uniref:Uncharacterized protein n=1 Tax=Eumeta variegata TaxID=151549 RepID=A0A4C1UQW7_EUMVA|nr:hypothetical protein EVAR_24511_1 [Eumeta japonica]
MASVNQGLNLDTYHCTTLNIAMAIVFNNWCYVSISKGSGTAFNILKLVRGMGERSKKKEEKPAFVLTKTIEGKTIPASVVGYVDVELGARARESFWDTRKASGFLNHEGRGRVLKGSQQFIEKITDGD